MKKLFGYTEKYIVGSAHPVNRCPPPDTWARGTCCFDPDTIHEVVAHE